MKSSYSRILRHCIGTTVLLSAYLAVPGLAQQSGGQTAQGSDKFLDFFRRTELSGFVDVYYGYNFNTPATRKAGPERTFDVQHNSFSLNLAELSLEKKPTDDSRGGFRVDLDYGPHPVFSEEHQGFQRPPEHVHGGTPVRVQFDEVTVPSTPA